MRYAASYHFLHSFCRVRRSVLIVKIGWKHVQDDIELQGASNPSTRLVWSLKFGEDPDDAYSAVPYEKVQQYGQYVHSTTHTIPPTAVLLHVHPLMRRSQLPA